MLFSLSGREAAFVALHSRLRLSGAHYGRSGGRGYRSSYQRRDIRLLAEIIERRPAQSPGTTLDLKRFPGAIFSTVTVASECHEVPAVIAGVVRLTARINLRRQMLGLNT